MSQLSTLRKAELITLVESLQAQLKQLLEREHHQPRKTELIPSEIKTAKAFDINVKDADITKINAICTTLKKYGGLSITLKGQAGRTDSINVYIKKGPKPATDIKAFAIDTLKVKAEDITLRS